MALGVFSKFYYGFEIDFTSNKIDFNEGSGELTAELDIGIYTPEQIADEIKLQMDAAGTKTYTVTFDRDDRLFTIAADSGTFSILISSGTNAATSPYDILGFTGNSDLSGSGTYTSPTVAGYQYRPQFWLQDYTRPEDWIEKTDAAVTVTALGESEIISFGDFQFTEFNMLFITDSVVDGKVIRNNQSGVDDANQFMTFAIKRGPIEFMPDESDTDTFYTISLESTPESSKGIAYKLKEETGKNLPGFYQTGKLKWRVS